MSPTTRSNAPTGRGEGDDDDVAIRHTELLGGNRLSPGIRHKTCVDHFGVEFPEVIRHLAGRLLKLRNQLRELWPARAKPPPETGLMRILRRRKTVSSEFRSVMPGALLL